MKLQARGGFTLIEMLTVMAIIAILASLVLSVNRLVNDKGARARAESEIAALTAACQNYKGDNGTFPRDDSATDTLDPRKSFVPTSQTYKSASLILYKELCGDANLDSVPGDEGAKIYYEFKADMLSASRTNGKIDRKPNSVRYLQDPWGNSYGYSTIGAKQEEDYRESLRTNPSATRPTPKGFNSDFDLWSTAGSTTSAATEIPKWIKNW